MSARGIRVAESTVWLWVVLVVGSLGLPRLLMSLTIDNNTYFAVLWSVFIVLTTVVVVASARRNHHLTPRNLVWLAIAVVPAAFVAWAATTFLWQAAFGAASLWLIGTWGYVQVLVLDFLCALEAAAMIEYFGGRLSRSQLREHAPNPRFEQNATS